LASFPFDLGTIRLELMDSVFMSRRAARSSAQDHHVKKKVSQTLLGAFVGGAGGLPVDSASISLGGEEIRLFTDQAAESGAVLGE
jgi:hypothetical protein